MNLVFIEYDGFAFIAFECLSIPSELDIFTFRLMAQTVCSVDTPSSLRIGMERKLYLWRSSDVVFNRHLVILADRDGAHVVLVT